MILVTTDVPGRRVISVRPVYERRAPTMLTFRIIWADGGRRMWILVDKTDRVLAISGQLFDDRNSCWAAIEEFAELARRARVVEVEPASQGNERNGG